MRQDVAHLAPWNGRRRSCVSVDHRRWEPRRGPRLVRGILASVGGRWVIGVVGLVACLGCTAPETLESWTLHAPSRAPTVVTLPTHLDLPGRRLGYSLETTAHLDPARRGVALELVLPKLPAPARLVVDGRRATPRHEPTRSHRAVGAQRFSIPAELTEDGELELVVEVDHLWTQAGWWTVAPSLVLEGTRDPRVVRSEWVNHDAAAVSFTALLQIGFVCLGVFLLDRRRIAYLLFAIQMLSAAIYPLYTVGWLNGVVGMFDVPLLAGGLVVAAIVSVHFTHVYFGLPPASRGWLGLLGLGLAITALATGPFQATQYAAGTVVVIIPIVAVHQLLTCVRLVLAGGDDRHGPVLLLVAWLTLAGTSWVDLLFWAGGPDLAQGARPAVIGLAAFATFMAFVLSRRHITSLNEGDRLNAELARRVDDLERHATEIESLNVELRRQIGERSNQIVAALTLSRSKASARPRLATGDVVQGRYRVVGELGSGGMGSVYEVVRLSDDRHFALKLTHELDATALARLAREAQIASAIRNPHVVGVIDVDVSSHGFLFVVMELVRGMTLRERRVRFGDRPWAIPILGQIADGLAALHEAGIVHRDLKPGNVLLTGDDDAPTVRIADFGVSRLEDLPTEDLTIRIPPPEAPSDLPERVTERPTRSPESDVRGDARTDARGDARTDTRADTRADTSADTRADSGSDARATSGSGSGPSRSPMGGDPLTRPGDIAGTPLYMAPETAQGRVGTAGDVFGFGVLAFELLTGRRPFDESLALALLEGRDLPTPPPISSLAPDVEASLAALVTRCLARVPSARPSARELVEGLGRESV